MVAEFHDLRCEYLFGQRSRFSSTDLGSAAVGCGAEFHTRNDPTYFRMVETARHLERNDRLANAIVTRLVSNVCRKPPELNPQTGDEALDKDLKTRWWNWATSTQSDYRRKFSFHRAAKIALRRIIVDGDVFGSLTSDGSVQWLESHRCRTPGNALNRKQGNAVPVHGVERDINTGRVTRFYFTKGEVPLNQSVQLIGDTDPRDAFDKDGNPLVLQLALSDRFSGARGVTAFAQTQDDASQLNDAMFAELVKMQTQSCVTFLREREIGFDEANASDDGEDTVEVDVGDYAQRLIEMAPGKEITGRPGEKLSGFTPTVGGADSRAFVMWIAQCLAMNLGVPLALLLFDFAGSSWSGGRLALDAARQRFDEILQELIDQLYLPVYLWQLRRWMATDEALRRASLNPKLNLLVPTWNKPAWASIQPVDDATADGMLLSTGRLSMTEYHHSKGRDWDDVFEEIVASNAKAIRRAKAESAAINSEFPDDRDPVAWFDLLPLPTRGGYRVNVTNTTNTQTGGTGNAA